MSYCTGRGWKDTQYTHIRVFFNSAGNKKALPLPMVYCDEEDLTGRVSGSFYNIPIPLFIIRYGKEHSENTEDGEIWSVPPHRARVCCRWGGFFLHPPGNIQGKIFLFCQLSRHCHHHRRDRDRPKELVFPSGTEKYAYLRILRIFPSSPFVIPRE